MRQEQLEQIEQFVADSEIMQVLSEIEDHLSSLNSHVGFMLFIMMVNLVLSLLLIFHK